MQVYDPNFRYGDAPCAHAVERRQGRSSRRWRDRGRAKSSMVGPPWPLPRPPPAPSSLPTIRTPWKTRSAASLDEAYLDVTEALRARPDCSADAIVEEMRAEIFRYEAVASAR